MELESENGSKITLLQSTEIGRGLGLDSNDKTLSRRQISLSLKRQPSIHKPTVLFEVTGKNPVWVYHSVGDEIKVYKRSDIGEMDGGDRFCLSGTKPVWFSVRERGDERGSRDVSDLEKEIESIDVSALDPVKDFGFLVIGHEFDNYPKHKIRPLKTWDWFLEEPKKESDDDDETYGRKRNRSTRRKRKKGDGNDDDDDEWAGESEEDKDLILKSRKLQRPKYSTRSKGHDKPAKDNGNNKSSNQKKIISRDEEDEEEEDDEDDDTLGGFIVKEDEVKEEEEEENDDETELDDEEEEDDFEEDDDED